jgi:YesN/AraC family two-component response regulator
VRSVVSQRGVRYSKRHPILIVGQSLGLGHSFVASGFKANEYLQRLRIQKVCELLESTKKTFEVIAYDVGYGNVSACRKSVVKIIGLTPNEFRRRFV